MQLKQSEGNSGESSLPMSKLLNMLQKDKSSLEIRFEESKELQREQNGMHP